MASNFYQKLGKKISFLRKEKNFTREMLAEKAGLSAYYLGEIERGEKHSSLEILIKIAKALSIELHELLNIE